MSAIKSKVDVKEVAIGAADPNKKDKGKKAAPEEGKELSKKEKNKLEAKMKKEKKQE